MRIRIGQGLAFGVLVLALMLGARPADAYDVKVNDKIKIDVRAFVQSWLQVAQDNSPDGDNWAADVFIRRARLIAFGEVTRYFKFLFGTVTRFAGRDANYTRFMETIDAHAEIDLGDPFKIHFGLMMIPFLHNMRQAAGNMLLVDWHIDARRYPVVANNGGRDAGLGIRGLLFDDYLSYFFTLFRGTYAGDGVPRITSRVVLNLAEPEDTWYYAGTYLGKKKVISIGLAADAQPDNGGLNDLGNLDTYYALGGDVFVDLPLGPNGVTAQVNYAYHQNSIVNASSQNRCTVGDLSVADRLAANCRPFDGHMLISEFGYRFGKLQPVAGFDWVRPDGSKSIDDDYVRLLTGLNYWHMGHTASLKAQYSYTKSPRRAFDDGLSEFLLQAQVMFR